MTNGQISIDHDRAVAIIESVDRSEMSNVVGRVLGYQNVEILDDWAVSPIGKSYGRGTIGICIVSGSAEVAGEHRNWSMAAKVMELAATQPNYYDSVRSEIEAYSSGLLETLAEPSAPESRFRAAGFFGLTYLQGGDLLILWLEDLSHLSEPRWSDDAYAMSAKHIGHFNATWLFSPPDHRSWFHEDGYRTRFANGPAKRLRMRANQDDRYVQLVTSEEVLNGYGWLSSNQGRVFDFLQTVEHPLSHTDSQPKNLFPGTTADGSPETIAIDWSTLGYAALGTDAANLVGSSLMWLEIDVVRAKQLEPIVFESYLDGLHELNWRGDRDVVWLGYLTVATCRAANASNFPGGWIGNDQLRDSMVTNLGRTLDEMANHWREVFEWMLPRLKAAAEQAGIA